jgi:fructose-bisphosphate aldolase class II
VHWRSAGGRRGRICWHDRVIGVRDATWDGILGYYKANEAYLQGQLGNPKGEDQPNKKYYDPRVWLRAAQTSMITRLEQAFKELNAVDVL